MRFNHTPAKLRGLAALAATVGLLLAGSAQATTVFIQFDAAYNSPITVDRTVDGGANWYAQDPGQFHFLTQPGSPAYIPSAFYTFCIEPREFVTKGQNYTYNMVSLAQGATNIGGMGFTKSNYILELLAHYYPDFSVQLDAVTAGAIQVAIWEIVRENQGAFNISSGDVQYRNWKLNGIADTTVPNLAASMLASLTGKGPRLSNVNALAQTNVQDTMVQVPGVQLLASTPEPGTGVIVGLSLLPLVYWFRHRRSGRRQG